MNFPHKDGKHQAVFHALMAVVGAELAQGLNGAAYVILMHVDEPLGHH